MPKFQFEIEARKVNAIGIRSRFWERVEAPDRETAVLKLYDTYEHISVLHCEQFVTRYAVTHINKYGSRVLSFANQGRNHFDTREAAEAHLAAVKANNNPDMLRGLYGDIERMEVRPVDCYSHGDAVGIYFDE